MGSASDALLTPLFLILFSLGIHDWHFPSRWSHIPLFPICERQSDFGLAVGSFCWHGVMEKIPSTTFLENEFGLDRWSVRLLIWKLDLGNRVDIGGNAA